MGWKGDELHGAAQILEFCRRAEQALGSRFVIREFHSAVLEKGSVPLDILEELVESYIFGKEG